ncbi:MAG: GGDEF domain-containing protein [Gammaproteobacteria bacterium]
MKVRIMVNTSEATNQHTPVPDTDHADPSSHHARQFERATFPQFQQQLNIALQRTLDVETQLRFYHIALSKRYGISSLSFYCHAHHIKLDLGHAHQHRCQYDVKTDEDSLGLIILSRATPFLPEERIAIEHSTRSLAYPLRNALQFHRALQSALTDPLTGAGNRQALDETLQQELKNFHRYNRCFSVALIDLDHFKKINDCYGHDAGDTVLKTVTNRVKENSRATDRFFRYGGEEFVLLMSNTNNEGATVNSERLCNTIASVTCSCNGTDIPVTMSVGVATSRLDDTTRQILHRADRALYQAKSTGRNRVINAEYGFPANQD